MGQCGTCQQGFLVVKLLSLCKNLEPMAFVVFPAKALVLLPSAQVEGRISLSGRPGALANPEQHTPRLSGPQPVHVMFCLTFAYCWNCCAQKNCNLGLFTGASTGVVVIKLTWHEHSRRWDPKRSSCL